MTATMIQYCRVSSKQGQPGERRRPVSRPGRQGPASHTAAKLSSRRLLARAFVRVHGCSSWRFSQQQGWTIASVRAPEHSTEGPMARRDTPSPLAHLKREWPGNPVYLFPGVEAEKSHWRIRPQLSAVSTSPHRTTDQPVSSVSTESTRLTWGPAFTQERKRRTGHYHTTDPEPFTGSRDKARSGVRLTYEVCIVSGTGRDPSRQCGGTTREGAQTAFPRSGNAAKEGADANGCLPAAAHTHTHTHTHTRTHLATPSFSSPVPFVASPP